MVWCGVVWWQHCVAVVIVIISYYVYTLYVYCPYIHMHILNDEQKGHCPHVRFCLTHIHRSHSESVEYVKNDYSACIMTTAIQQLVSCI